MKHYYSLVDHPLNDFEYVEYYERKLFRKSAFVLESPDLETAERFFGTDISVLSGIILINRNSETETDQLYPGLLVVYADSAACAPLKIFLETMLVILNENSFLQNRLKTKELDFERQQENQKRMAEDFERIRLNLVKEIKKRRLLENRARDSERKTRALLDMGFSFVGLLSPSGKILDANQTSLLFINRSLKEIQGCFFWETPWWTHSAAEQEKLINAFQQSAAGEQCRFETTHQDSNGKLHNIDFILKPVLNDLNEIEYLLAEGWDITARKQAEEAKQELQIQLLQSQKMETVGQLAGGIAHDFNNMLNVIIGETELALMDAEKNSRLSESLNSISTAAERSAKLTRQLLVFARQQTINPVVINLNEAVSHLLDMLHRLVGENIQLRWNPGESPWPVYLDSVQLDQVLSNLTLNARDAISDGGWIQFTTGNYLLEQSRNTVSGTASAGEYAFISIKDSGSGMTQDTLSHIFEPFYTTKETGQGTGLGLAMVLGFVQQHNGYLEVESEPGAGSQFTVCFPRYTGKISSSEKPFSEPERGKETILVVEDEEILLDMSRKMLETLGYSVITANTPAEALKYAERHEPSIDLLLTDVIMPEMNGKELADIVRKKKPSIRIVFMSGYPADVLSENNSPDSGVQFIQKPFKLDELSFVIRKALSGTANSSF